jgi:hypothetical protein
LFFVAKRALITLALETLPVKLSKLPLLPWKEANMVSWDQYGYESYEADFTLFKVLLSLLDQLPLLPSPTC